MCVNRSHGAEESDEEGDTEIYKETVDDGEHHDVTAGDKGYDGQRGIHSRGTANGYWGEPTEPPRNQRGTQQGYKFADDIGKQGNSAECRAAIFGYENAWKRIITEAAAYGEAVSQTVAWKKPSGKGHSAKRSGNSDKRKQKQPWADWTDAAEYAGVTADVDAYEKHQRAKGIKTDFADIWQATRHKIKDAHKRANNKETDDYKTVTHEEN